MVSFLFLFLLVNIIYSFTNNSPFKIYGVGIKGLFNFLTDASGLAVYFNTATMNPTWWYMAVAITLIFSLPLCWAGIRKFGIILLPLGLLLPKFMGMTGIQSADGLFGDANLFSWYIMTALLGVFVAEYNIIDRIKNMKITKSLFFSGIIKFVICTVLILFLAYVRMNMGMVSIVDALLSVIFCCTIFIFIKPLKPVYSLLQLLGKHSMNMFLIHTFIFAISFHDFIYSFKYGFLILAVLVIVTVALSCIIELLKKLVKLSQLKGYINKKIDKAVDLFENSSIEKI